MRSRQSYLIAAAFFFIAAIAGFVSGSTGIGIVLAVLALALVVMSSRGT